VSGALVLGGGACLWKDLDIFEQLRPRHASFDIIATNDAGWAYRLPIAHWVTLHPVNLPTWKAMRELRKLDMRFETWGGTWITGQDDSTFEAIDHVLPVTLVGSSGMHAVNVARHLELHPVVLAGIPMDGSGHFFDPTPWASALAHREAWTAAAAEWGDAVRSMSGWTAELLGTPDRAWIDL